MPISQNHDLGRATSGSNDHEVRTAIILAAGMGVRLKDRGKLTPKGCLCLGEKSIAEESVLRLLGSGIQRIVIVTGHFAEQFIPLKTRYSQTVQLVHNPHFADSGSMYSLYCARHCVDESFLLLESDLVYERRALTSCLEHPSDNVVLLAGFSNTSDECFVETQNGHLVAISKERESLGSEVTGEMVGICKISRSLFRMMVDKAGERFNTTRHLNYETDGLISAARDVPISCSVVADLIWCEIDDETHLARARNKVYPVVQEEDAKADVHDNERLQSNLSKFKAIGFFDERDLIIRHVHDLFASVNEHQIRACIMFGTLLGKLRHDDIIPWDDDVDVVIFDFDDFLEHCAPELERQGYTVEPDVRDGKRMGCRIFREDSAKVPGKPRLRFPWIGIWEHDVGDDGLIVLPPELYRYQPEDFLPIGQTEFLGVRVGVPHNPTAILNTYFESEDWMEVCQLPYRDHRNGGELTGYPDDKFKLQTVLDYLVSEQLPDFSDVASNDAE
jgi:choline kinase